MRRALRSPWGIAREWVECRERGRGWRGARDRLQRTKCIRRVCRQDRDARSSATSLAQRDDLHRNHAKIHSMMQILQLHTCQGLGSGAYFSRSRVRPQMCMNRHFCAVAAAFLREVGRRKEVGRFPHPNAPCAAGAKGGTSQHGRSNSPLFFRGTLVFHHLAL